MSNRARVSTLIALSTGSLSGARSTSQEYREHQADYLALITVAAISVRTLKGAPGLPRLQRTPMKFAVALLGALFCVVQARYTRLLSDADVSSALTNLANADTNGAQDGDLDVDYQNMASKKHPDHDNAPNPLFRSVSTDLLAKSNYVAFSTLIQQFTNPDVNVPTTVSDAAINAYFDVISQTPVWSYAHSFLQKAGLSPEDPTAFRKQLKDLWFSEYTLEGASGAGASGFKSVFAGEIDGKAVYALNNWVRYFHLEEAGEINYHGWFTRQKFVVLLGLLL
uniref:Endoribonuclease n=1 Tax=Steinernema glaseri TaxID=37863 RepID=A0A1I7Y663_9BILA